MDNTQFAFEKQRRCVSPGQLCSSARDIACCREQIGAPLADGPSKKDNDTPQQLSRAIYIAISVARLPDAILALRVPQAVVISSTEGRR